MAAAAERQLGLALAMSRLCTIVSPVSGLPSSVRNHSALLVAELAGMYSVVVMEALTVDCRRFASSMPHCEDVSSRQARPIPSQAVYPH